MIDSHPIALLDNLTTAIMVLSTDYKIEYLNPAAEMLLQASLQQSLQQNATDLFYPSHQERFLQLLCSVAESKHSITKRQEKLTLLNKKKITADITVTLAEDKLLIEIQPLDRLLKISREEAMLAEQHTSQLLVRGLAHEIKNPLGGLRGAAQLLSKNFTEPQIQDYTSIIIAEADRLRELVDRLLGSNKITQKTLFNIHEALERVRHLIEAESGNDITITCDYDPSIPELTGDKSSLIQALLNIVRNAMHALQHTDKPLIVLRTRILRQLTIGSKRHQLVCHIDVIDNGSGIPEDINHTLFLPMISGNSQGTGLGLSIAQSIVNQHQGLIECNSQLGRTCFSIYLPISQTDTNTEQLL